MKKLLVGFFITLSAVAQSGYWQQAVDYKMDIFLDVDNNQYSGNQELVYTNNSPESLKKVYYHLYFNAFQPGSMMDTRSRNITDPDRRVGDRIYKLSREEQGYIKPIEIRQDGISLSYTIVGTVMEVELAKSILPGKSTTLKMNYNAQIPVQIRRSGRDNAQGIDFTMTQWYPKMAEYDEEGWHLDQYVGREFHGVWGNFDVCVTLDNKYILGASGVLQNPEQIKEADHGYMHYNGEVEPNRYTKDKNKNTWHFIANNVHDFAWAADPDYIHKTVTMEDGRQLHFLYQEKDNKNGEWEKLQVKMPVIFLGANEMFGLYPYSQYSFIQGGDGGMEYPMCTMVKSGSIGTAIHEMMHSWYQGMLATNESKYEWMDEGFTVWASEELEVKYLNNEKKVGHSGSYRNYNYLVNAPHLEEEPICSHADMYHTNAAYGISAYSKGDLFLQQLADIIGKNKVMKTLKTYYDTWAFKHPNPERFIRIAEKVSGIHLDWYLIQWTKTTNHIEYDIFEVKEDNGNGFVRIEKNGKMMMPVEMEVEMKDGRKVLYYMPLYSMYGRKELFPTVYDQVNIISVPWTDPFTLVRLNESLKDVKAIKLNPSKLQADIKPYNDYMVIPMDMDWNQYVLRREIKETEVKRRAKQPKKPKEPLTIAEKQAKKAREKAVRQAKKERARAWKIEAKKLDEKMKYKLGNLARKEKKEKKKEQDAKRKTYIKRDINFIKVKK